MPSVKRKTKTKIESPVALGYAIQLRPLHADDGGGWLAEVPDLPGCMSDGETPDRALSHVEGAIRSWIEAAEEDGRPIPQPTRDADFSGKWVMRVPRSLHRKLAEKARAEGVSLNALATALLAEGVTAR